MKITLLGTGSPLPDPDRAGPSTLVHAGGSSLLFDCGRGVVMRLAGAGLLPVTLSGVALTHLHSDHVSDLNDVITTHWVMSSAATPLRIIGPLGTRELVDRTLAMLSTDVAYRISHHEDLSEGPLLDVLEVGPGDHFEVDGLDVVVGATDHRPVAPTVAYRVSYESSSVVVAGDGVPCVTLDELVAGATAYVQTVIRDDLVRLVPSRRFQDILDYHSTVQQAAETAERAGVAVLILTHYVPALTKETELEWRQLAAGFSGTVIMGDDLTSIDLEVLGGN
ncbi:MAG: MBL fold metallo-hydrolase [Acidimicrobiales bacterium]|jgi:ribonuclease Z